MNNTVQPIRPAMPVADTTMTRHATAVSEIQKMTEDYRAMQLEVANCHRELDSKDNKIELLEKALSESHHYERIYRNKLIRLASAMQGIGRLAVDAEKIMMDVQETEESAKIAAAEKKENEPPAS